MTKDGVWRLAKRLFSTHILTRRMTAEPVLHRSYDDLFNSHPHKEDDWISWNPCRTWYFSTHILTRRMTLHSPSVRNNRNFSTHILTRRMTFHPQPATMLSPFQLTSSQGGWQCSLIIWNRYMIFQLTSSQGGWPKKDCWTMERWFFNSHPHKEDDSNFKQKHSV